MPRPRRLYTEKDGKLYYLIKGKKVYVKAPPNVTNKQIQKVNIKNIITIPERRRVKKTIRDKSLQYEKKIDKDMIKSSGLNTYTFKPESKVKPIQSQFIQDIEKTKDTTVDKLTNVINKLLTQSKLPVPSIESESALEERPSSGLPALEGKTKDKTPGKTPGKKPGKTSGPEPVIRPSSLVKLMTNWYEKNEGYPSLDEVNNKIKSQYMDVTREQYNTALDQAGEIISEYLASGEEKGLFEKYFRGKGDVEDGLYNDELETISRKRLKYFVPVIANDGIDNLTKYVKRGDTEFAFIINTDNMGESGRHWRCCFIDDRDDFPTVEWYDPLTETAIPDNVRRICKKICYKMNPEMMFKFKSNCIRRQSRKSSTCGVHCVKFLEDRHNGIPFSTATGYDEFIEKMKSEKGDIDQSESGEKSLKKVIPTYGSYI